MEKTQWLKGPLARRLNGLRPHTHVNFMPYYGKSRPLHLRHTRYSIGSDQECDISIDDPFVSQRHGEFFLNQDGGYSFRDLSSKNGSFLNGTQVASADLPAVGSLRIGRSYFRWSQKVSQQTKFSVPDNFICRSPQMIELLEKLHEVAKSDIPILILGETGTGKELLARMVHDWSFRKSFQYVALNAATLEGSLVDSELFGHKKGSYTDSNYERVGAARSADKGTLFLDELGELPLGTQAKLLRLLESGEVRPGWFRHSCIFRLSIC